MFKIISHTLISTPETLALKEALEERGIHVRVEPFDGFKHIDIGIPKAKLNVEVDGIQHLTNPSQIVADLDRGYFSNKKYGFATMHIPNEMIRSHEALAKASKIRERRLHIHVD